MTGADEHRALSADHGVKVDAPHEAQPRRVEGVAEEILYIQPAGLVYWAWAAPALIALFAAVWLQMQLPQREIFLAMNHWASSFGPVWWSSITLLGDTGVVFCLVAPLLLWRPQMTFAVLAAVPVGGLLSVALKALFQAHRPATLIDPAQFTVIGPLLNNASFPSGHTLSAFAAAIAMVVVLTTQPQVKPGRFWSARTLLATTALLALATLAGFSRVAVGAHWPVDVLAGAGCGWLAGLSGAWLTGRYPKLWQSLLGQMALGQILLLIAGWLILRTAEYPQGLLTVALAALLALLTVVGQFVLMYRKLRRALIPRR